MNQSNMSLPIQILLKVVVNIALVWFLSRYFAQYFTLLGGGNAVVITGIVFGALNAILRPILEVLTFPIRLFATLIALIIVHGLIIYVALLWLQNPYGSDILLTINGGVIGWLFVMMIFGLGNWAVKELT